ncbi:MAG: hypothetical protein R6X02_25490 [Enhygromyxa sp.]
MSRETITCEFCKKETRADDNACYHCHYLRKPIEFSKRPRPMLAAPPRPVPFVLPLVYALRPKTLIFGLVAVLVSLAFTLVTGNVTLVVLVLVLLAVIWGKRYLHARRILSKGVVGPAKVIRRHRPFGLEGIVVIAKGWELTRASFNGHGAKDLLALRHEQGPEATFRRGGLFGDVPYDGGFFIFDPNDPRKRIFVEDFPLVTDMHGSWSAVRPDENGRFQVHTKVVVLAVIFALLAAATIVSPTALLLSI